MTLALNIDNAWRSLDAYNGFDEQLRGWRIPRPVNAHTHLRDPITQPNIFKLAVRESAKLYDVVTAMPNLGKNRIRMPEQAIAYREACRVEGRQFNQNFDVTVPLYIEPNTEPQTVLVGHQMGAWKCGKVYPKNGTTGSDHGVDFRHIETIFRALSMMEKLDMLCLVHGEVVLDDHGDMIADRKRETRAIDVINEMLVNFPLLRIVFEHISSWSAVEAVESWQRQGYRVEATVAPQYLVWNSTVLFAGGVNPVRYSIPILKDEIDRQALVKFVVGGGGMLGTDSAPHDITAKSRPEGCPGGVFNEPVGLFAYFHTFRTEGGVDWLQKFVKFACVKARELYGEPPATESVLITEEIWDIAETYTHGNVEVIPMYAGMTMPYSCKPL